MPKFERMDQYIQRAIQESIQLRQEIMADTFLMAQIEAVAQVWVNAFLAGQKLLFCGNGGSAADA